MRQPLRVLAISARSDHGGGPKHLLTLLEWLSEDIDFTVAAPLEEPYGPRFQDRASLVPLPHRRFSFGRLLALRNEAARKKIQLVHSHGKGAGIYARMLRHLIALPVVHTFHGIHYDQLRGWRRRFEPALERYLAGYTDVYIHVSQSEKQQAAREGLGKVCSVVIPNGVEVSRHPPEHSFARPLRLLNISRLSKEKGVDRLLDIAEGLRARGIRFHLTVVGDGPDRGELEQRRQSLGLTNEIRFCGFQKDVKPFLSGCDVYISASTGEGMPLTILEAMAQGLPVVASRVPGHIDLVVHGRTGFLFSLDRLSEAMEIVSNLADDPAFMRTLGLAGHQRVRDEFSLERMTGETEALYRRLALP